MHILLICAGGWSTGLLVEDMKNYADEQDVIEAKGYDALDKIIDDFDVILVGPQISYKFNKIKELCLSKGKVTAKIDPATYGRINGKAVYEQAKQLYHANYHE